jgi:lysophospholipase L1-like esterase
MGFRRTTICAAMAILAGTTLVPAGAAHAASAHSTAAAPSTAAARSTATAAARPMVRLMALGDSITYGTGSPGRSGYRIQLQAALKAAGMNVDFVGSQRTGLSGDRDNEGHGGWSIGQLDQKVVTWLAAARPDIVLLHAGTNNVTRGHDPADIAAELSKLIDDISAARPTAEIFVSTIVQSNRPTEKARNRAYNALVPGVVAFKGPRVHLVDQSAVGGGDLYDGHHPNAYGYSKMSYNFYTAIRRTLPSARSYPAISNPALARTANLCFWNDRTKTRGCANYARRTVAGTTKWVRTGR